MKELLRLLIHVADSQMANERPSIFARMATGLLAGVFMTAALVCALTSLWIYLLPELGPAGAPLAIAGVLLVLGLIFLMLSRRRPVLVVRETVSERRVNTGGDGLFGTNRNALLLALFSAAFQSGVRR